MSFSDRLQDLEPVHRGEAQIEQNQIERHAAGVTPKNHVQGRRTIASTLDSGSSFPQNERDQSLNIEVVLDQQHVPVALYGVVIGSRHWR